MAKKTESSVKTNVKTGIFKSSHLSISIPASTPPTMIAAIWMPIPEYLRMSLGDFFGELLFFGSFTFYVFYYAAHAAGT